MANALAAIAAPLDGRDVRCAADELSRGSERGRIISLLLVRGSDVMQARQIVEALKALRDLAA